MAGELRAVAATGKTLYAIALNGTYALDAVLGYFDAFGNNPWGNYAIPLTEIGSWGIYAGDLPYTGSSGRWWFLIFDQAGGSPANGDALIAEYMQDVGEYGISGSQDVLFAISGISIPSVVDANLIGFGQGNSNYWPNGNKNSLSGNNITVNWSQSLNDDDGTGYVGWMVWFQGTISGYPTIYFSWQTVVTAVSGNTITVAEMPEHDLTYKSFKVYLFPPGFAAGGGGGASVGDIVAGLQSADPPIPADVVEWKSEGAPEMTGDAYARLGAPAGASVSADIAAVKSDTGSILEDTGTTLPGLFTGIGAGSGTGYYSDTLESPSGTPIDGARVMLATDEDGENVAYEARTDAFGLFEMRPDPGTYYRFIEAAGHTFTQGVEVEVEEA